MRFRCRNPSVRTLAAAMAATWWLGMAGCGQASAPQEPAWNVWPYSPIAGYSTKSQKVGAPRVDPAVADAAALAMKAALALDSRWKSFAVDIRTANGSLEFIGTVDASSSREKAE